MRNVGLDLLRLLAVVLVLGNHLWLDGSENIFLVSWQRGGWVGVDIFFVLSGFLISSLLFREAERTKQLNIKRFLIRRGFKIYPAFYVFLLITIILKACCLGEFLSKRGLVGELVFLQNYVGRLWGHTWSLAVEEHFYFCIAILFGVYTNRSATCNFKFIPLLFVFIAVACLLARIFNGLDHHEYSFYRDLARTHLRIDSLFFGVLIAFGVHSRVLSWLDNIPTLVLFASGGALLYPAFACPREANAWINVYGVVLFYIGSGFLLLGAIRFQHGNTFTRWLASLGAASYSIYLWHMPINHWGYPAFRKLALYESWWIYFLIYVVGSCLVGWLVNRLLETPVIHLRDRLFPSDVTMSAEPPEAPSRTF